MPPEEVIETEISEPGLQSFSVDEIDLEPEAEAKPEETEIEVEGKETKVEPEKNEVAELKATIQELQKDLLKLSLNKKETLPAPTEQKQEKLTKAQLVQIMKEHKDNPEVLANVIEYMAEQKANETRDATMKDVNQKQWHSNLSGMANRIISEDEDGYLAANPKVSSQLDEYAQNLGMGDHPVGKLAAYAILRLSESVKAKSSKVEETKPDATPTTTKGKMEKTRLAAIRDKNQGLSTEQLAMAKRFGVKPETYAKFVGRK